MVNTAQTTTPRFSADTVIHLLQDTYLELAAKHPGFYRYVSRPEYQQYIDSLKKTITDSLTEVEVYQKLKPFTAKMGCLHTGVSLPAAYTDSINHLPNLFPFQVAIQNNRMYVIQNFSGDTAIHPGDEIVQINSHTIPQLLQVILPAIPSDGNNTTLKYRAVYHLFPTLYRNLVQTTNSFQVQVLHQSNSHTFTLPAKSFDAIASNGFLKEVSPAQQLHFSITDSIGVLTIHSFSVSDIKKSKQQFSNFINAAFQNLNQQHIPHLIVDLRNNTGGSDGNAALLTSYFFDTAYRYWDRIEVTEAIAKDIKGATTLFYRKPIQKDNTWLWQKARTVRDFDYYETQKPAKNHYTGKVYVLINGFCMSSCADVTAVLAHHQKATFIGEETGGGYQGNNSGLMPVTTLAPTRLRLTVPLQAYYNAVNPAVYMGRGTMPDYTINETINDYITGNDPVMKAAIDTIKKTPAAL
ncbi:S41 family peptidase [Filimonas lacunae]|uniref:S41 family peptidase n=1 Tax=Filimonas lacunae TaxID=477680 RepID=UPI0007D71C67|nr:S41 family peptidase [Filimonas lacunae]BAV06127.1 peptidase, S41 family [Filimonas lacunae]